MNRVILAFGLLFISVASIAQTTSSQIGNGANSPGISTNPINRQGTNSGVSEYLWTKADLNAAGINNVVNFTGIQFDKRGGTTSTTNNNTTRTNNVKVYMMSVPLTTTTLSGASWSTAGYTQVFGGASGAQFNHSGGVGWKEITFASNFLWDNNSNIKVLITYENNSSLNSTDRPSWRFNAYAAADAPRNAQCRFGTTNTASLPTGISLTGNKANVRFRYNVCAAPTSPSFSAGATTLCVGGTSTYTASATGGSSVSYAILSGGATINSSTGVVSSVTSNFTVRATITNACGSVTVDRAVTVTSCCATTNAGNLQHEFSVQTRCSGESISANNIVSTSINAGTGALRTVWFVGEWLGSTWGNWVESTPGSPAGGTFSSNLNAAVGGGNGDAQSISNYNPLIDFPTNNRFLIIRGSYNFECASWCVPSCVSTSFELRLTPAIPAVPNVTNSGPICAGNTATLSASGLAIQGKTASFNGSTSVMGDASYNTTTNNFTIEFWASPSATRASTAESTSGFDGTAGNQRYVTRPWQQGGGVASSVGVSVGTNGVSVVEHDASHAPIPLVWDGTLTGWNHIAVVYNNKVPHLYVNGELVKIGLQSVKANVFPVVGSNKIWGTGANDEFYNGGVENLRIFNIAKTEQQIIQDMHLEAPITSGLIAHYTFNNSNGNATVGTNTTMSNVTFNDPSYYTYTWSGTNAPSASVNQSQTTGVLSSSPSMSFTVIASAAGCSSQASSSNIVLVNAPSIAPSSVDASNMPYCIGGEATLTQVGGSLASGASWEWFSGSCGTTPSGIGTAIGVSPTTNTTYYVRASAAGGCPPSNCAQITVNAPNTSSNLANNNDQANCYVPEGDWIHFYSSGRLIASVRSQDEDLGELFAQSFVGTPHLVNSCTEPSNAMFETAALGRSIVIRRADGTPLTLSPGNTADVRIYFSDSEWQDYLTESANSTSPDDTPSSLSVMQGTKFSHNDPTLEDGDPTNNCSDGTTQFLTNSGTATTFNVAGNDYIGDHYIQYTVNSFSEFYAMFSGANNSALPVSLTSFSASCNQDKINITWTTASELNASHYILQSSRDGQTWLHLAEIDAVGTTNQASHYSFEDQNFGALTYYRLVQVDNDGQQEVFGPISSNCSLNLNTMTVHPNPTSENFTVLIQTAESFENAVVELLDMSGRVVMSQTTNISAGSTMLNFDGKAMHAGTYMLRVKDQNDKFTPIRVVKM